MPNLDTQSIDASNSAGSTSSRKGRGKAKNQALTDHIKATGQKPRIEIPVGLARPVGKWSREFVSEVGIICRTYAPLTCYNWKSMKKHQRKAFHERIRGRFDIDLHLPHVGKVVNSYMGQRFKDYRCRLYQYYKRLEGDHHQRRRHPYEGVSQEHWYAICDRFQTEDFKKLSEKNSANRKFLHVNHCAGSKSFVRYREELRLEELNFIRELTMWKVKMGVIGLVLSLRTSPLAKKNHEEMLKLQSQPILDGCDPLTEDEICDQVLGTRPGYICGLGHGKVPLSFSSTSFHPEMIELTRRAEEAEKLNEELNERVLAQDRKIEEMKAVQDRKMEEMQANMEGMTAKIEAFMLKFGGEPSSGGTSTNVRN